VINNCFNARAMHAAVAAQTGTMRIPTPDYLTPASFGSLELRPRENNEFIGQQIDYSDAATVEIRTITIDSLDLAQLRPDATRARSRPHAGGERATVADHGRARAVLAARRAGLAAIRRA